MCKECKQKIAGLGNYFSEHQISESKDFQAGYIQGLKDAMSVLGD